MQQYFPMNAFLLLKKRLMMRYSSSMSMTLFQPQHIQRQQQRHQHQPHLLVLMLHQMNLFRWIIFSLKQFIRSIRRVQYSSIRWKPILLCGLLARKWCSIGCELVQSYVGTEMEYIRILQGKESQTGKLLIQLHCTLSRYIFKIHKVLY